MYGSMEDFFHSIPYFDNSIFDTEIFLPFHSIACPGVDQGHLEQTFQTREVTWNASVKLLQIKLPWVTICSIFLVFTLISCVELKNITVHLVEDQKRSFEQLKQSSLENYC